MAISRAILGQEFDLLEIGRQLFDIPLCGFVLMLLSEFKEEGESDEWRLP